MADEYVGHSKEISEDSCITAKRESFKQGANAVLQKFEMIICGNSSIYARTVKQAKELIRELKGK